MRPRPAAFALCSTNAGAYAERMSIAADPHRVDTHELELLLRYLQQARDALLWKLEGVSEYDARRPMTATGTNLLGLVKHMAGVEHGYLTESFGRPSAFATPWYDDGAPDNADMWATVDESREFIVGLYRAAWASDDAAVRTLGLDAVGEVAWWKHPRVTMRHLLVHLIAETHRHAGHADILRETIDGRAGLRGGVSGIPRHDAVWWADYVETLERTATEATARHA